MSLDGRGGICFAGLAATHSRAKNTPTPWQRSGQLGSLTHRATVRSLPWDLFCLCCINSFLSYLLPVGCRPALTACSLRGAIIRENYAMFTQHPKVSHHWFCFPPPVCHQQHVWDSVWRAKSYKDLQGFSLCCKIKCKTMFLMKHWIPRILLDANNNSVR